MILKRVPKIYIVILLFLVPVLIGTRYFINNKQVDFNAEVKPLINKKCISCHDLGNASAGYDFSSYTSISANANAILGSMKQNGYQLMPIGGPALPDSTIQKIACWISQGKLDN